MNRPTLAILGTSALALAALTPAHAGFFVNFEKPGVQWPTVTPSDLAIETFNADHATTGNYTTWNSTAIGGTYTLNPDVGSFTIDPADQWGGSTADPSNTGPSTQYLHNNRNQAGSDFDGGVNQIQLDLNQDRTYFGLWWSAGSPDVLNFLNDGNIVFSFSIQDVIDTINGLPNSAAYYGNPTPDFLGQTGGEPFAYINFFATGTTVFDQILLRGNLLESDNHAVSSQYIAPNVPEAGTNMAGLVVGLGALGYLRRRNQAQA